MTSTSKVDFGGQAGRAIVIAPDQLSWFFIWELRSNILVRSNLQGISLLISLAVTWFFTWSRYFFTTFTCNYLLVLQPLTQKKSNFAWGEAKLSEPARQLSFAFSEAKLLFFCVKGCKTCIDIPSQEGLSSSHASMIICFEGVHEIGVLVVGDRYRTVFPPDFIRGVFTPSYSFLWYREVVGAPFAFLASDPPDFIA